MEDENIYPKVKVAAAQVSQVFMDREATIRKACDVILEAGRNGADLITFPEAYVPAYPYWSRYLSPLAAARYTKELIKQAVQVPSASTEQLCRAARDGHIHVVIGINEKIPNAHGTLFNTNLLIDPDGRIVGRHRKLVPTYCEKLVWAYGDANGLRAYKTKIGKIGSLMCGENSNALARFVLIADGEQIHVANYYALPKADKGGYNLAKDIEIRSAAHSFEGKVFTVVPSLIIDKSAVEYFSNEPELQKLLESGSVGYTAVYGPGGYLAAGPLEPGVEGILYADINLEDALLPKLRHDIAGSYNRFDLMHVSIRRDSSESIHAIQERASDVAGSLADQPDFADPSSVSTIRNIGG